MGHALADLDEAGGRYATVTKQSVTGATPGSAYPQMPGHICALASGLRRDRSFLLKKIKKKDIRKRIKMTETIGIEQMKLIEAKPTNGEKVGARLPPPIPDRGAPMHSTLAASARS